MGFYFLLLLVRSTVESGVFAPHPIRKFLVKFFSKNLRAWAEPIKRRFLFAKLFLCASRAKEKAVLWLICFIAGDHVHPPASNLLKQYSIEQYLRKSSFYPQKRTLYVFCVKKPCFRLYFAQKGLFFFIYSAN